MIFDRIKVGSLILYNFEHVTMRGIIVSHSKNSTQIWWDNSKLLIYDSVVFSYWAQWNECIVEVI